MYGRTNDNILKSIKWMTIGERYQLAITKFAHKHLNSNNNNRHFITVLMTENRNIMSTAESSTGPKQRVENNNKYTLKTLVFKIKDIYKRVPKELTLLSNSMKFKKCIKK